MYRRILRLDIRLTRLTESLARIPEGIVKAYYSSEAYYRSKAQIVGL
jgi:hypothetical protein